MALTISSTVTLHTGAHMSLFGFGTWRVPAGPTARQAVGAALAAGYRLIDTASAYGNEEDVGAAVAAGEVPREALFLTTKVWNDEQGAERTPAALRDSLARLGLACVDLYLIHWSLQHGVSPSRNPPTPTAFAKTPTSSTSTSTTPTCTPSITWTSAST